MQIAITFRHTDSSQEIKEYAREKLSRLEKYADAQINMQVIFTQERHRRIVEAILKANSLSITGQEEASDFFSSIDAVVDNLERQLKKQKNRNKKQKESQEDRLWRIRTEEGAEENTEPQVIVSRNVYAKPMSLEEAVMQMKLSDNEFIVFMDSFTEKINVIYRRNDGNFGLIEPGIS